MYSKLTQIQWKDKSSEDVQPTFKNPENAEKNPSLILKGAQVLASVFYITLTLVAFNVIDQIGVAKQSIMHTHKISFKVKKKILACA